MSKKLSKISRRSFVATGAAVGLSGCIGGSGDGGGNEEQTTSAAVTSSSNELADSISVYTWGGTYKDAMAESYGAMFEEEYDVTVNWGEFGNDFSLISKQRAGDSDEIDVVMPTNYSIYSGVEQDLLLPLREENFENLDRINDKWDPKEAPGDPGDEIHHLPNDAYGMGIVYNHEEMDEPNSWSDLWTDQLQGSTAIPSIAFLGYGPVGIAGRNIGIDVSKLDSNTEEKMSQIWDQLGHISDYVVQFFSSNSTMRQMLNNEEAYAGGYFYARAVADQRDGIPVSYTLPDEGAPTGLDTFAVAAGTNKRYTAEKFLDFCLRSDPSKAFAENFPYLPAVDLEGTIPEVVQNNPDRDNLDKLYRLPATTLNENKTQWQSEFQQAIQ